LNFSKHNHQENAHVYYQQRYSSNRFHYFYSQISMASSFGEAHHIDNPLVEVQDQLDGLDQFK